MVRTRVFVALWILFAIFSAGCVKTQRDAVHGSNMKIYASFYPLYDFAVKIGGEKVDVINMIPTGAEPHGWEPTPQVVAGLLEADLFIFNGLGLEPWVEKVADTLESGNVLIVKTTAQIDPLKGYLHHQQNGEDAHDDHHHAENGDVPDPHVWLDPLLALRQAEQVLHALVEKDPDNESYYRENFYRFEEQIQQLDAAYRESLKSVRRLEFVVTHLSFGYLAHRYGLTQYCISGISPHTEPSPSQMKEMVDFIRQHKVPYIFQEPLTSSRFAEALSTETGVGILTINPLAGLTSEEMEAGEDYFSIMYHNLRQLEIALKE